MMRQMKSIGQMLKFAIYGNHRQSSESRPGKSSSIAKAAGQSNSMQLT